MSLARWSFGAQRQRALEGAIAVHVDCQGGTESGNRFPVISEPESRSRTLRGSISGPEFGLRTLRRCISGAEFGLRTLRGCISGPEFGLRTLRGCISGPEFRSRTLRGPISAPESPRLNVSRAERRSSPNRNRGTPCDFTPSEYRPVGLGSPQRPTGAGHRKDAGRRP